MNVSQLIKSYEIAKRFDATLARQYKTALDTARRKLAIEAIVSQTLVNEYIFEPDANNTPVTKYLQVDENNAFLIRGFVGYSNPETTLSLYHTGKNIREIGANKVGFYHLASGYQEKVRGAERLSNLDEPLRFDVDENLQLTAYDLKERTSIATRSVIYPRDRKADINLIDREILARDCPQEIILTVDFTFTENGFETLDNELKPTTQRLPFPVIIQSVSSSHYNYALTIIDTGKKTQLCENVNISAIAGYVYNNLQREFELPQAHFLSAGSRLEIAPINGDTVFNTNEAERVKFGEVVTIVFKARTI